MKNLRFWLLLICCLYLPLALVLIVAVQRTATVAAPQLLGWLASRLPPGEQAALANRLLRGADLSHPALINEVLATLPADAKQTLYDRMAASVGSWHDVLPEPDVGRIAKRDHAFRAAQADIVTNNAGLRSHRPFTRKPEDIYRVICLGDSAVFGSGGAEADRFCDQLEAFYAGAGITAGGKRIETYAVGIPSWTAVNEATYLSSRISHYDPDLVIVLTLTNDITDTAGVTGAGVLTQSFSPEYRVHGSGVFSIWPPFRAFTAKGRTALQTDLGPESRRRWAKAMARLHRLEVLQRRRGAQILFGLLHAHPYFTAIYRDHYRRLGFEAPFFITDYFPGPDNSLPHDPHPNRRGHQIIAHHLVHLLATTGIIPVPAATLPPLEPRLSPQPSPLEDGDALRAERSAYVRLHLPQRLDFDALTAEDVYGYLGGFFPERPASPNQGYPFASLRSGFLLARPSAATARLELEIEVPPHVELYPFTLEISLHGELAETFTLTDVSESGRHTITAPLPALGPEELAVEVMLETSSYWTTINDGRMKSFYLVAAEFRDGTPAPKPAGAGPT